MHLIELLASLRVQCRYGSLERIEAAQSGRIARRELPHFDEGANYIDAHLYGSSAIENHRSHDRAMFGEDTWAVSPTAPPWVTPA